MTFSNTKIHFMGIGGIGMSALAEIAAARGAVVSGCDREESENTDRLRGKGIAVTIGHHANHAQDVDRLIYTSAVPHDHPERLAAEAAGRAIRRGSFLAELMRGKKCIGICGTHGKTSTTWLTAQILIHAGLDPTVVVGGVVPNLTGNVRLGAGEWFVTELDESDGSFVEADLAIAVITNVESEHLHYYKTFARALAAYREFTRGVVERGCLIAGMDSQNAADLFAAHEGTKISFGMTNTASLRAEANVQADGTQTIRLTQSEPLVDTDTETKQNEIETEIGSTPFALVGRHNVQNALAAAAVALRIGVSPTTVLGGLATCRGVDRRLQKIGMAGQARVYDDYAHHPTEIRAAIAAVRTLTDGKILAVFQPHLYSRTRDYAEAFATALSTADATVLADLYPARETPIAGVDSALIVRHMQTRYGVGEGPFSLDVLPEYIMTRYADAAVILIIGAGDIWKVAYALCR